MQNYIIISNFNTSIIFRNTLIISALLFWAKASNLIDNQLVTI